MVGQAGNEHSQQTASPKPDVELLFGFSTPLKMHFFRDSSVSAVLESSCIALYTAVCARGFLALTKKSLFLECPLLFFKVETRVC